MISRRQFLKSTTIATLSIPLLPELVKGTMRKSDIGLQLYTVRDKISLDLQGTLEEVARIGYTWLESAGYGKGRFYNHQPEEFKKMIDDLGMTLISSHASFDPDQTGQVIEAHLKAGIPNVVFPWMSMPEQPMRDDYLRKAEQFNKYGEEFKKAGLRFGYHNHAFEFVNIENITGYDILLEYCDPELVFFEADIYWMRYADIDPLALFSKYPDRFSIWHVKDMDDSPERSFEAVGEGIINYKEIFKTGKKVSGMEYFFVEQDSCKGDSLETIAISFKNLKKIL